MCAACDASCSTCDGATAGQCLSCPAGSFFLQQQQGQPQGSCVQQCPVGSFADVTNQRCASCHPSCAECSQGAAADQCTACPPGTPLLYQGRCLSQCPPRTYAGPASECLACDATCALCDGQGPNRCTACGAPLLLSGRQCVVTCPQGEFQNSVSSCGSCSNSCATCSGPLATNCLSCELPEFLSGSSCVASCPVGTFADLNTRDCTGDAALAASRSHTQLTTLCHPAACQSTCATCSGPSASECVSCGADRVLDGSQCLQQCSAGRFNAAGVCQGQCGAGGGVGRLCAGPVLTCRPQIATRHAPAARDPVRPSVSAAAQGSSSTTASASKPAPTADTRPPTSSACRAMPRARSARGPRLAIAPPAQQLRVCCSVPAPVFRSVPPAATRAARWARLPACLATSAVLSVRAPALATAPPAADPQCSRKANVPGPVPQDSTNPVQTCAAVRAAPHPIHSSGSPLLRLTPGLAHSLLGRLPRSDQL